MIVVNIPAVAFAQYAVHDAPKDGNFDVWAVKLTDLFSMADIVTVTMVVPIFSCLWTYTTTNGCLAGMASGILTILVWGWAEFRTFNAGPEMITMMCFGNTKPQGDGIAPGCGFYAYRAVWLFPTIVLVTAVVTYGISWWEKPTHAKARDATETTEMAEASSEKRLVAR